MTIQDFNEALNEQQSTQLRSLAELKQDRVRAMLSAAVEPSGWPEWPAA